MVGRLLISTECIFRKKMPEGDGFVGCIKNLTFTADSKTRLYDLGSPADGDNFTPGCDAEFVQVNTFFYLPLTMKVKY